MALNTLTNIKLEMSLSKKSENPLQELSNIFETAPILKEVINEKSKFSNIYFVIKSDKYDVENLKNWLAEKILKTNGETVLSLETSELGKRLTDALSHIEQQLNVSITILRERENFEQLSQAKENNLPSNYIVDILIRKKYESDDFIEIRVAIVGNVDAGKSTLLGVLTHDLLDNGRGEARAKVFKHKHEQETGRTSSIGDDVMGFDSYGNVISNHNSKLGIEKVCNLSSKIISFCDLAGHEKYFKTTVFGMTGYAPDFCMLMVGANMGICGMTKEHLGLALALSVPVLVVITKIDICPTNVFQENLKILQKILKSPGCRKIPYIVENSNDVITCALNFTSERLCPIFMISNVTGKNIDLLKSFLNLLNSNMEDCSNEPPEFELHAINSVPGVGTVISGTCFKGKIKINDTLMLGPDIHGKFKPVVIKGMHRKRVPVNECKSGQTVSFAIKKIKRSEIRKGMFLLSENLIPISSWAFEAEILVLHHPTTIQVNYQAVVHCGSIKQSARIVEMSIQHLRTGDRATVKLAFILNPEYLKVGSKIVFREGRTKAVGQITKINLNK